MKILILSFLICLNSFPLHLKKGDILLQPLHCYLCNLIEGQTNSIYSHIGIVIESNLKGIKVAESFQKVREVSLEEFSEKTQKNQKIKVMRPKFIVSDIKEDFYKNYIGRSYDHLFLWDNFDKSGPKLYCSELVYKLLARFSYSLPQPTAMKYDYRRDLWDKYFKGNTPEGEIGISPAAFDDESFFDFVGEI
ncbi:MAG: YiiX/YebB-like N1pC/P60 family cysteine hydrolase [Bacteriovoracaceae bacterium]|jgi:uncharacterized protein YycO|nr:YiiX/YebB-like N1pC/P60 family cysteine hydrolase [Bacteriovoracaceae bacterium]